jgi:hypothetical protein
MYISIQKLLLIVSLVSSGATQTQASETDNILDQLINTYGGEVNLRKMDSMTQEWDLVAVMGNRHGTDFRSIRAPGQLRVDLTYPDKFETRILNDGIAHVIFKDTPPKQVSGMQRDAMQLQLMRLYSPLMLRDKIDSVSVVEQGDQLALSLVEHGVHVYYMVNRENWRIEKVAGSLIMKGREIQFLTEYSDFAVIEGVLVHQKENKYASGMNTAKLRLKNITFNAEFDDRQFKPEKQLGTSESL